MSTLLDDTEIATQPATKNRYFTWSEVLLFGIFIAATLMKMLYLPGGTFFTAISLMILSILYFPLGFITLHALSFREIVVRRTYKKFNTLHWIASILAGMALSLLCMGIMYTRLNYAGASVLLQAGMSLTAFSAGYSLIKSFRLQGHPYHITMLIRQVIWLGCGIGLHVFYM